MLEKRLILASSSPRRALYLKELGYLFSTVAPQIDESMRAGESPHLYVRRLAMEKAEAIAQRYSSQWIVAADTTVVINGNVLGKPTNHADARRMLKQLAGNAHRVLTALTILRRCDNISESDLAATRVIFRPMTEMEIRWYVASGECLDKAGAYAIQGKGGLFVKRIEGSFSNVVGFPVETFYQLVLRTGLPLPSSRR